ncbi:glycine--tRNA ligase subunit beta [Gordonibacter massiliensis (ex Traore et al. 2017)]|uniref:Glycine--tRNA ligase beta subunit n=1 Tax=Gordonibacter massiliensis (ex Traore et al. 2017) TaxID=1841863 RepID=A0A842JFF3_9ACTN|nr:glycine--tRNA ligase subunit beta [Gordonibacter massiliensis (ex Traore et al. 2017)]MBC2889676.1 glycine--tRNA ligase subunit beta [Gordonibacter massiliensis (ex Traore et al. 2017)]
MSSLHTLAFEVGTEEIPAFDLHKATQQLEKLVPEALDAVRVPHGDVSIHTTPRRLIALVEGVADATEALEEVFRGPSAKIAFDAEGNPTKAAVGFARGKGLDVDALERREENGAEYVFATRSVPARDVAELLPGVLEGVITGISWPKSCRWGTRGEYFSRPVRWLVALLDERVIPVEFAGLTAGKLTCGHRFLAPGPHEVARAADLLDVVENAFVVTSEQAREQRIREGVAAAEAETGYRAELPEKTLLEVTNLAEYPTVLVGTFDEEFLRVPEEIIVDAMLMHQRYFPLYDAAGKLTNKFIVVTNGDPAHADTITGGNERVVRARLSDAKFFYEEDLKHPLETYVDRLDEVVFQEALGTMKDKSDRIVALAKHLAADAQLGEADAADAERAAYLAKADLVTNAVVEFTSVQGVMGSYYAEASGEGEQVARAIADHYRPRFSGDEPPASDVGKVVAMADKLDTICGLFAVGQGPTGSSDPFALRRSAIGILAMLEAGLPVSLMKAVDASLSTYESAGIDFDRDDVRAQVADFFVTRTKVMLRDSGASPDAIDAVLAAGVDEPAEVVVRVRALEAARKDERETFDDLATAYARANNLRDASLGDEVDEALMGDAERALLSAVGDVEARAAVALASDDYAAALAALATLRGPIDAFFADVLVMDEDESVRANRLRLLNRFVDVFASVADFGKMAKGGK